MKKALLASVALLGLSMGTAMAQITDMANEGNRAHNNTPFGHNHTYHGGYGHHALTLVSPGVLAPPHWHWRSHNGLRYYDLHHGFYAYLADPAVAKSHTYFEKDGEMWVVTKTAPTVFYGHHHHGHHIIYVPKHPADDMLHDLLSDPMRAQPPAPETH